MKTKPFFITRCIVATVCVASLNAWYITAVSAPHALAKIHASPADFLKYKQHFYAHSFVFHLQLDTIWMLLYLGCGTLIVWLLGFLVPRKSKSDAPENSR